MCSQEQHKVIFNTIKIIRRKQTGEKKESWGVLCGGLWWGRCWGGPDGVVPFARGEGLKLWIWLSVSGSFLVPIRGCSQCLVSGQAAAKQSVIQDVWLEILLHRVPEGRAHSQMFTSLRMNCFGVWELGIKVKGIGYKRWTNPLWCHSSLKLNLNSFYCVVC